MLKSYIWLSLLISLSAKGQRLTTASLPSDTIRLLQGQIVDKGTKQGVSYATVTLKGASIGTNTDADGHFRLRLGGTHRHDTVRVSAIGYQSASIAVRAWQNVGLSPVILLKDTVLSLPDVVVKAPPPAVDIIRQAMANRQNTYLIEPHKLEGLYRIADRENGRYVRLTEAAIAVYDQDWIKKDSRVVEYLGFRHSKDYRRYRWHNQRDDFKRVEGVLQVDFIKRPTRATHENGFTKGFSYELTGYTSYDGQDVYVITARPRPETAWANYSAVFYVRRSDLAILQVDRDYNIPRPDWVDTDTTVTKMTRDWISLRYREQDHKMRLHSCVIVLGGDVLRKRDKTKIMDFERSQEVIFSSMRYQRLPRQVKSLSDEQFQQASLQFNPEFWHTYQEAVDTDLFRRVQADLSTLESPGSHTIQPAITSMVAPDTVRLYSPAQLQADFQCFRKALEEAHPGLYRYTTKPAFDRLLDSVAVQLQHPRSERQFFCLLSKVVAHVHCGHTGVALSKSTWQAWRTTARVAPVRLTFRGERVFINSSVGSQIPNEPDLELVDLDGQPIQQIVRQLVGYLPADGYIETSKRKLLERHFAGLYSSYLRNASEYTLTLRRREELMTLRVQGVPLDSLRLASPAPSGPELALRYLSTPSTALLTLRSFGAKARDSSGRDLPTFLSAAFTDLHHRHIQHLIVDLRGNQGGRDDYGALLYAYLTSKPFRYYQSIGAATNRLSFLSHTNLPASFNDELAKAVRLTDAGYRFLDHPGLSVQQPRSPSLVGDVYILIDGDTFSAAAEFAAIAHDRRQQPDNGRWGKTIFIGEETGGAYAGNNSGSEFKLTLPATGVEVFVPLARYVMAVGDDVPAGRGVLPDHYASGDDDETLRKALALIEETSKR